jgi:hypothetical protein
MDPREYDYSHIHARLTPSAAQHQRRQARDTARDTVVLKPVDTVDGQDTSDSTSTSTSATSASASASDVDLDSPTSLDAKRYITSVSRALSSVTHASMWVVNVVYDGEALQQLPKDRVRGFGFLVPSHVSRNVNGPESRRRSVKEATEHPLYGLLGVCFDSDVFPSLHVESVLQKESIAAPEQEHWLLGVGKTLSTRFNGFSNKFTTEDILALESKRTREDARLRAIRDGTAKAGFLGGLWARLFPPRDTEPETPRPQQSTFASSSPGGHGYPQSQFQHRASVSKTAMDIAADPKYTNTHTAEHVRNMLAPQLPVVYTVMAGGDRFPDLGFLTHDEAAAKVLEYLKLTMGITVQPTYMSVNLQHECIPQQFVGHNALMRAAVADVNAAYGYVVRPETNFLSHVYNEQSLDIYGHRYAVAVGNIHPKLKVIGTSIGGPAIKNVCSEAMTAAAYFARHADV